MIDSALGKISLVTHTCSSTEAQHVLKLTPSITEARVTSEAGSLDGELQVHCAIAASPTAVPKET